MEQHEASSERKAWGTGRVAFRAHLPAIQKMLADGHPLTSVFLHFKDSFSGLSYNAFVYQARKHLQHSRPRLQKPVHAPLANDKSPEKELSPKPAATLFHDFQPGPKEPDIKELF